MTAAADFAARCPGARSIPNGYAAPCPAHGGRKPNLRVRDGRSGVLVRCMSRGCEVSEIAAAVGLHVSDLFTTARCGVDAYAVERRQFQDAPSETLRAFIARQTEEARAARLASAPHDTPRFRSRDVNTARTRANLVFRTTLAPIKRFAWEGYAPHDSDPAWPDLFGRALEELAYDLACVKDRAAMPDAIFARPASLCPMAADRAATWLRSMPIASTTARAAA